MHVDGLMLNDGSVNDGCLMMLILDMIESNDSMFDWTMESIPLWYDA